MWVPVVQLTGELEAGALPLVHTKAPWPLLWLAPTTPSKHAAHCAFSGDLHASALRYTTDRYEVRWTDYIMLLKGQTHTISMSQSSCIKPAFVHVQDGR